MDAGSKLALPRAIFIAAFCATFFVATIHDAQAQIWVVDEADGAQRFTTSPEPGARIFLRTRHSTGLVPVVDRFAGVPFGDSIVAAASESGLEAELVQAVIAAESNFDPNAISDRGAQGLMQLMPATAADLGVRDVWDPYENVSGGARHLARLLSKYEDVSIALAAYNAGEGAVERNGGIPPFQETQEYVERVLGYYRSYKRPSE